MALANIAEVEKSLGLESGKLQEMLSSEEEHSIDLTSLVIMNKSDFESREKNVKTETIKHTQEVFIKELRNDFELELEGKTKDNLINAFKTKMEKVKNESVKDPEERYTTLKGDFDKLQKNYQDKEAEVLNVTNTFLQKEKTAKIKNDVFQFIPENTLVSKNTILIEAEQKGFTFDDVEGMTVVKDREGNILKSDTTFAPIGVKDWMATFVTPYVPKAEGGSGGKDEKGKSTAGSYEEFMNEAEKQGWDNTRINEEVMRRTKEGTLRI